PGSPGGARAGAAGSSPSSAPRPAGPGRTPRMTRDVHADLLVVAADPLEQVELRFDVDPERRRGLVERRLHERLRREVEDALRLNRRDELLDRAGIRELAVEQRDAALVRVVAQRRARRVAALDEVELALREDVLEILHPRSPP